MSIKILQLEGLTDLKLSHLLEKLMTTIPGVSAANLDFLTQNLTLTLEDGADVSKITEQAAAEIGKHAPDVTVKFQDVSAAREKPRLNVPVRPISRPAEEDEDEDGDDFNEEDDDIETEDEDSENEQPDEKKAAWAGQDASWQLPSRLSVSAFLYCVSAVFLFLYRSASGLRLSWMFLAASFCCCALSFFFPLRRAWYRKFRATAVIAPLCLLVLFLTGAQFTAAASLLILRTGYYLSSFFFWRVDAALRQAADLCPETVRLMVEDTPVSTAASAVAPTNKIFVLAGEPIGLDGVVCEGNSRVRAVLPGPKDEVFEVNKGDTVRCGDLNLDRPLTVTVTGGQAASLAQRVKDSMLSAVSVKNSAAALIQAQKYSRAMTLFFLAVILLSAAVSALGSGQPDVWMRQSSVALLILCSCGLEMAARASYVSELIRALKNGIAVRGAEGLDALSRVRLMIAVGFSKIFAAGEYRILAIEPVEGIDAGELLETAAYAESASTHPIAAAIRAAYEEGIGDKLTLPDDVQTVETVPGYGARAMIGKRITLVGSARFMQDAGVEIPADETGDTMVYIAVCGEHMGSIRLENPLRGGARAIGPALCSVGVTSTHIISGCDESVLSAAKKELLVDEIHHAPSQSMKQNILSSLVERLPEKEMLSLVGPTEKISSFPGSCCRILTGEVIGEAAFSLADAAIGAGGPEKLAEAVRCGKRTSSMMLFYTALSFAVKGTLLVLILTGSASAMEAALVLSVLPLSLGLLSFGSVVFSKKRQESV